MLTPALSAQAVGGSPRGLTLDRNRIPVPPANPRSAALQPMPQKPDPAPPVTLEGCVKNLAHVTAAFNAARLLMERAEPKTERAPRKKRPESGLHLWCPTYLSHFQTYAEKVGMQQVAYMPPVKHLPPGLARRSSASEATDVAQGGSPEGQGGEVAVAVGPPQVGDGTAGAEGGGPRQEPQEEEEGGRNNDGWEVEAHLVP